MAVKGLRLTLLLCKINSQLVDDILEVVRRHLAGHDLDHLLANGADLCALCIRRLLRLVLTPGGEANTEEPQHVTVGCLYVDVSLDQRLKPKQKKFPSNSRHFHFNQIVPQTILYDYLTFLYKHDFSTQKAGTS